MKIFDQKYPCMYIIFILFIFFFEYFVFIEKIVDNIIFVQRLISKHAITSVVSFRVHGDFAVNFARIECENMISITVSNARTAVSQEGRRFSNTETFDFPPRMTIA